MGIRERNGHLELFDRTTGAKFVPRGANYLRKIQEGADFVSALFQPSTWNGTAVDTALRRMRGLGYNTVRVFIDLCHLDCISKADGTLRGPYLENIARFLRIAKRRGLTVLLASVDLPEKGFGDRLPCCVHFDGYRNSLLLSATGHAIGEEYFRKLIRGLKAHDAPLDTILAYELQQEHFVLGDEAPLSLGSGTVVAANGQSYEMGDPAEERQMVVANVRLYMARVRHAIRSLDPGALVTMGFFASFPDDERLVYSNAFLHGSAVDFFDLHLYGGMSYGLDAQVTRLGLDDAVEKPVIMGEFGAFRVANANPRVASWELARWQAASCGHGFDGWLVWLWSNGDDEVWGSREGNGAIDARLAPSGRPNPCSAAGVPRNLALQGTATASAETADGAPALANDGLIETVWSSGGGAPQWIEIDLGSERTIREIHLDVAQDPAGLTTHVISVKGSGGMFVPVKTFMLSTEELRWLVFKPASPLVGVQVIRVETTSSPSWVAWRDVRAYS